MGPRIVLPSLLMLLLIVGVDSTSANPAPASGPDNVITGFEVFQEQDQTRLVLRGKRTPTFTVFKLKNPDRLVVDLIRTDLEGVDTPHTVDNRHIGRIATTQFKQAGSVVSRFMVSLKPDVRFSAKAQGNSVVVTIAGKDARLFLRQAVIQKPEKPEPAKVSEKAPAKAPAAPVKAPAPDHKVVDSSGDRNQAKPVSIRRIVSDKSDSITILTNRKVEAYEVLEVYTPFRLVLDLHKASMRTKRHDRKLTGKHANRVRVVRHQDKVRVVLDCADGQRQPYQIERLKRGIRIHFAEKVAAKEEPKPQPKPAVVPSKKPEPKLTIKTPLPEPIEVAAAKPAPEPKPEPVKPVPPATLRDLTFRQDPKEARVILDLEGQAQPKVVHADKRSVVLEIPHCKMPLVLERTLDTSEFGSAIKSLSAYRVKSDQKVKLVAVTSDQVSSRLERRDGRLHWVFATAAAASAEAPQGRQTAAAYVYAPDQVAGYSVRQPEVQAGAGGGKKRKKFRGKRISLDFKEADIHNILRLISEVAKLNIITSDEVKGKITITMRNVPWDQALDIILKTKKLGKVRHGNIIRVATMSELSTERELMLKAEEANKQMEPLRVRLVAVNYAMAKDVASQVKDVLSDRGTVAVDKRTNVLIIKDVLENLIKAEGLVRSLDTETPQVLIEARIVEANTQFVREVGVQWGGDLAFSAVNGNPTGLAFPSNMAISGGADDSRTNTEFSGTANPGHFALNMPAPVGAGSGGSLGFIFGSAGGTAHLNLRLSALENRGAVRIVSAPKITTLDNHTAKIGQGVSIPISVVSAAGVNTQFVEAKLELEVTPHITQEGSILMEIKVRKNEPDFSRTGARGDPTILKKEADTQVMVRDGDTTVIGGIYTKKTSDTITGVPVLSKIPILGWFFRNTKKNDDRTELLIFITPRIVNRMQATVSQR